MFQVSGGCDLILVFEALWPLCEAQAVGRVRDSTVHSR